MKTEEEARFEFDNLRYHDDVKNKFGFANINAFPKNFEIKDINENLNMILKMNWW